MQLPKLRCRNPRRDRRARRARRRSAPPPGDGRRVFAAALAVAALVLAGSTAAEPVAFATARPMDLANPEPRWVAVRFEVSPAEQPGRIDAVYSRALTGWLESEDDTHSRVTISGPTIESHLVAAEEPIPGSFSDFVWSFDRRTGHVRSATMEGVVMRTLDWGIARTRARVRLRFRMDTLRAAGFRAPRRVLGQPVSYFCDPDSRNDCVRVRPRRYDPATGYVNAVGTIEVENPVLGMRTFSSLGEATFHEVDAPGDAIDAASEATDAPGDAIGALGDEARAPGLSAGLHSAR